jgi:hypothetical protein
MRVLLAYVEAMKIQIATVMSMVLVGGCMDMSPEDDEVLRSSAPFPTPEPGPPDEPGPPEDPGPPIEPGPPVEPGPPGDSSSCPLDSWESNDDSHRASRVDWGSSGYDSAWVSLNASLCSEESDWYRFPVGQLQYEYYALYLDVIVMGSSWCGQGCEDPFLPAAPENTVTVEVYDAQSLTLLRTQTSAQGRVRIRGSGEAYSRDLLVHIHGPQEAVYDYDLYTEIRGYEGEDECEC